MQDNNKRETERAELHKVIWNMANELRGAVDGWDFKAYVLGFLFYRYISENFKNYVNEIEHESGNLDFDYAQMQDEEIDDEAKQDLITSKGYFIYPSELFENVKARAKNDENLNETLEKIFKNIEESAKGTASEYNFKGLFNDIDVNSAGKLGATVAKRNEKLVTILNSIASLNLGEIKDNSIDAFGDAYEYLMGMYASSAGKSGGEYYTPQEVSELLTKIAVLGKTEVNKVYDPACGSGALLLQSAKILGKDKVKLGFYGQELNPTTYNLCRINMFLHDIPYDKFNIGCEDTLITPLHWDDEPFEVIVSNPPYSVKWAGDDNPLLINDERFAPAGVLAPKSKADLAFIMHSLAWLAPNGVASIVCFPGVLYRGGAEQKIRKYLVDNNFVEAIIQLPDNLFFGTSIVTCIMVLKRGKTDQNIAFIDGSKYCQKVTNNNKLSNEDIENILKLYADRVNVQYEVAVISNDKIKENNYNLSISTYVEKEEPNEIIDIKVLTQEIDNGILKKEQLRTKIQNIINEFKDISPNNKLESLINELCPEGVEYKKITEIADTFIGLVTTMTKHYCDEGVILLHNSDIKENKIVLKSVTYLNKEFAEKNKNRSHKLGDIITVHTGDIGTSAVIEKEFEGSLGFATIVTRLKEDNPYYISYFLNSNLCKKQIYQKVKGDRNNLNLKDFNEITIPIPPLSIQEEIVRILDDYTEFTTELIEKLMLEFKARRKQYEYYRDKMFTFERKEK